MHRYIACGAYGKNLKKFRARCHVRCLETRTSPPRAAAARALPRRPAPRRRCTRALPRRRHQAPPRPSPPPICAAPRPAPLPAATTGEERRTRPCRPLPRRSPPRHAPPNDRCRRRKKGERKEEGEEGGRRLPSHFVPDAIFPVFPSRRRLCRQGIMMCHYDCRSLSRCDCRPSSRCDCRPSCRCFLQVLETSPCRGGAAKI